MYSDQIEALFKKTDTRLGDRISVSSGGEKYEGELMPKTDVGDPKTIIVKLDNGYNVGVSYKSGTVVKKVGSAKPTRFPSADAKSTAGLPKVTLIYTGGTIGSKVDYKTGGVHPLINPGELLYEVPELANIANITIKRPFEIWSEDMSYPEWEKMAKEVDAALGAGSRGIVITMGTDMMHYAAAALSFMLGDLNAPVVITGAQRSSDRGSSDAFLNLTCAVQLAAKSDIAEVGVCMHAGSSDEGCAFLRGTKVRKMHTSRRDAFKPVNDKPIALVDRQLQIRYNNDYKHVNQAQKKKVETKTKFESKVALLKCYPNSDPEAINFHVGKGCKGIIIEGTGLGDVPTIWLNNIGKAISSGVIVGITSQCLYGRVHPNVYSKLRMISSLGAVFCEDMLPETAYIKLGWLLGNYKKEEVKKMLSQNIVGEINARTLYDEFGI